MCLQFVNISYIEWDWDLQVTILKSHITSPLYYQVRYATWSALYFPSEQV